MNGFMFTYGFWLSGISPNEITCGIFLETIIFDHCKILESWTNRLNSQKHDKDFNVENHIDEGFRLHKMSKELDEILSPIITVHFGASIGIGILVFFGTTSILFAQLITIVRVTLTFSYAMQGLAMILFYFRVSLAGQHLENCKSELLEELIDLEIDSSKVDILKEKLQLETQLRPFGMFPVNMENFLSSLTVGFTFLIVLMQFKHGE